MIDFDQLPRFKKHQFEIVSRVTEWANAFEVPYEAVERQIPIAHAWCNSNPKKSPKKDPVRFLNNWMRIARNMGSMVAQPIENKFQEKPPEDEVMDSGDFVRMKEEILRQKLKARSEKNNSSGVL